MTPMQKFKELNGRLAEEFGKDQRDEKAIGGILDELGKAVAAIEDDPTDGPGYKATRELIDQVAQLRKDMDAEVEARRNLERLGLASRGSQIIVPGRAARLEMLRDGRAFMDDQVALRFGAYLADVAFRLWGKHDSLPRYVREIADDVRKQMKADMDPGVDASGGYIIPDEGRAEIIRNVEAEGIVFPRCRRLPLVTTGTTKVPKRTGGVTAYWTAPGAQGTRTAPTFDLVSLTPEKLMTLVAMPNEFLRSSLLIDLGQFLGLEISHATALALDNAIVNGDGSATYGGITGILQSANISAVTAASTHTTMATIDGTDISNVIAGISVAYAIAEAKWGTSLSVLGKLRALKATTGAPLYYRGDSGQPATVDDYPYFISPRMPASAAITAGTLYAFFGDLRMSHIVGMLRDIRIDRSEHALFEADMTVLRGIMHVDCQEADTDAVVTAKTAAS